MTNKELLEKIENTEDYYLKYRTNEVCIEGTFYELNEEQIELVKNKIIERFKNKAENSCCKKEN